MQHTTRVYNPEQTRATTQIGITEYHLEAQPIYCTAQDNMVRLNGGGYIVNDELDTCMVHQYTDLTIDEAKRLIAQLQAQVDTLERGFVESP